MVSVAVSKLGCTELIFVEPGVKVDGTYYRDVLLSQNMLPAIRQLTGDVYVFQQDSAPAHRARSTIEFSRHETPCHFTRLVAAERGSQPDRLQDLGLPAGARIQETNTRLG